MRFKITDMKLLIIFLSIISASLASTEAERILLTQNRFYSASVKALADAGVALPSDISSGLINPALTFSNHNLLPQSQGTILAGYGQDSTFNRVILPVGVTYSTSEGTLGLFYRFIKTNSSLKQHEMILNMAGQLFSKSDMQGAVDFGLNLRFEKMEWNQVPSESVLFYADDSGHYTKESKSEKTSLNQSGYIRDKRLILDIGFFQPQIFEHLDFGLTLKNLIGYVWSYGNSQIVRQDTLHDSSGQNIAVEKTTSFTGARKSSKSWLKNSSRIYSAGIVYHVPIGDGKLMLNIPIDLEILGLFDKDTKNRYTFRSGLEAEFGRYIKLRFGYSRAPGELQSVWKEIRNINIFTGGAELKISSLSINFFITENSFGTTVYFNY